MTSVARLLILSCSERKSPARRLLPAIERYDGPPFRVLRKFLRSHPTDAPRVLVLSAKYGLIESSRPIDNYDLRISLGLARDLRADVIESLGRSIRQISPQVIAVCLGRDYREAVKGFEELVPEGVVVEWLEGGLGRRLTALRRWLRQQAPIDVTL